MVPTAPIANVLTVEKFGVNVPLVKSSTPLIKILNIFDALVIATCVHVLAAIELTEVTADDPLPAEKVNKLASVIDKV